MFRKVGFVFCLLVLTTFLAQNTFAATSIPNYIPNYKIILPTPTPTPVYIHLPFLPIGTVSPTSTPTITPTPTNSPTATTTTTNQNNPTESTTPTIQAFPTVSPTPTPTPNQKQTLFAGLNKETIIITTIIILIIIIVFLTRWNIIKKWLNKKTS